MSCTSEELLFGSINLMIRLAINLKKITKL